MKTIRVILIGSLLSIAGILILASRNENGDMNSISMYFAVFLLPVLGIAVLNGIYLFTLNKLKNKPAKILLSLVPIGILIILSFRKDLTIQGIDGSLTFVTTVTAIALGLTNLIWIISLFKPKPAD
jgi:hypothetical protein